MNSKYKSIAPIIATVLLVVVAVILVTILLSFGKDITIKSLDKTNDIKELSSSDAGNFVYPKTFSQGVIQFNYSPPANLLTENIVITRYQIFTDNNETAEVILDTNYTLVNGQNIINLTGFYGFNITDQKIDIQLVTAGNQYIMLKNITNTYFGQVETPVADPVADTYSTIQSVALSSTTPGASIYYTIDGNTPTQASTLYTGAISIAETTTLKAKAFKTDWTDSDVLTAVYTINIVLELPWVMNGAVKLYIHPTDNSVSVQWGCKGTVIGASAQSTSNGKANTIAIIAGCTTRPIAANICDDLIAYGYSDWYLPATGQLTAIWNACTGTKTTACMNAAINKGGYAGSWVNFISTDYWSSVENTSLSSSVAKGFDMTNGSIGSRGKDSVFPVRCVRDP